ncbi:MAG: hypothetical protein ACREXU_18575 [Gammaproteobacteria bacterium]
MSTEQYLSWEDLLAEEANADASPAVPPVPAENAAAQGLAGPEVPGDFELPEELRTLFAERERLEQELKELTGEAEPRAEAERIKRMFPVKVHTKESRIEERRQRHRDELRRMLEKRVLEARQLQLMMELRREQQREELRRKAAEQQRVRERWVRERAQAAQESDRRRAFEAAWQSRRQELAQSRKEWQNRSGERETRAFEAAREASVRRMMESRNAFILAQRLTQLREQRKSGERWETQRCAAVEEAIQRRGEARALEDDREVQRQVLRDRRREERLQAQLRERRG